MKSPALLGLAAIALALASAPAAAQTAPVPPPSWTSFTPAEGVFTVQFPAAPKRSETPVAEGPGSPGKVFLFTSASAEGVFIAGWADYAPGFKFDDQAELAANRDNFVKGTEGKLLASRAVGFNGAPGIEFDIEKPGQWMGRARVYIIGGKPWQLIAITPGASLDAGKASKFFASFKPLAR